MTRRSLPQRRRSETFSLEHAGQTYFVSIGLYTEGSIGEVFVQAAKTSSQIEALARDSAIIISLALQFGCSAETLRHSVTRAADGSPASLIGAVLDALPRDGGAS